MEINVVGYIMSHVTCTYCNLFILTFVLYTVIILLSYSVLHATDRPNGPGVTLLKNKYICNDSQM